MGADATGTAPDLEAARFAEDHHRAPRPARTARANPVVDNVLVVRRTAA